MGTCRDSRRVIIRLEPHRHTLSRVKMTAAASSGNQPPWENFVRLAAKKVPSMIRKIAATGATTHHDRPQRCRATTVMRQVVMTNVPVTAIP